MIRTHSSPRERRRPGSSSTERKDERRVRSEVEATRGEEIGVDVN